jgi:hypothetical protein
MATSIADGAGPPSIAVVYTGGGDGAPERIRTDARCPRDLSMIRTLRLVVVVALLGLALSMVFMLHPP